MVLATKKNCQRVLVASLRVVSAMTGNPPLIKIADGSEFGWKGANEYEQDEFASDSANERRIFRGITS